ncbi:hypothetical protein [Loigolactobacillus coryniformis]|nr:hypothetical protein [Loigolactobacillus coryniformis]
MSRGFIQFEKINFEVGGISGGDGTNIESPYFARTKLGDLGFKGIAISNFNSGKYKWKIAEYNADQKFIKYVDDWSTGQNLNIVFKPGNYYRLLVTSTDSSQIDINDLVLNLKIADLAKKMTYNLGDMTRNFDYSITVGGGLEPKFNIDTKQNITIVMPLKPLTIFDGLGSQIKTSLEETAGKSYTLATGQFLIWNLQKNTINVQSVNDPRDLLNVILADNIYGNISNGYFSQFYTRKIAKNDLGYQINIAGNDHPSFVSKSDNSLDVIMPNNAIFYFNHFGKQVKMSTSDFYGKVINLPTNSVLIWNFDDNKFVVQPDKNERSINSIMLANNMYNHITSGYFERYFEEQFGQEYSDSYRKFSLTPIETNDQDMTMAGDELWIGLQSSTDHDLSKTGQIIRFDHSMKKVGRFVHNLGHLSTLDYCAETDTLLIGNASDDPTAVPEVMLIPNIKKIKLDPDWPMIDYNSDAVIKIQFPDLSSMGIGAVFGESPNILYLLIGGGPGMNSIVKVSLGIGNSDLSSAGYGNFIENTTSYNGTAQYVRRYYGRTMQVNQGATFYDGKIYAAFARHKTRFAEIKLHEPQLSNHDGYYEINDWSITRNDEPNGVVIFDGFYFRTSIDGFIVDMPIFNEQGGIGNVGEIITMKFEGTNIQMTPTSAATDLYLTNVKPDSFIVRSVSDQHGTFNWRARIN